MGSAAGVLSDSWASDRNPKGASVARMRPIASEDRDVASSNLAKRKRPNGELTPAEAHAQRRSAPLTPRQFKAMRELAARGVNPLSRLRPRGRG